MSQPAGLSSEMLEMVIQTLRQVTDRERAAAHLGSGDEQHHADTDRVRKLKQRAPSPLLQPVAQRCLLARLTEAAQVGDHAVRVVGGQLCTAC